MKKIFLIFICIQVLLPFSVDATGGGLRKNSIKTCPNGVTYGMHSDGKGGTHWHVAITNGNNYYADGKAIYKDPCPSSSINKGTAGSTNGTSSSSSSIKENSTPIPTITPTISPIPQEDDLNSNIIEDSDQTDYIEVVEKSSDNTIKSILIDDDEIEIGDTMVYETIKKHLLIKIETNDDKAKVDYENKVLSFGENTINILVTAENGDKKNYSLVINKIRSKGTVTLKKFLLDDKEVEFKDNKATVIISNSTLSMRTSYILSDANGKLKMYLNDKAVSVLNSVYDKDKIKLVVTDENDNENIYEIIIEEEPTSWISTIVGLSVIIIFIAVIVIKIKSR